jgi:hypothetical protein
MDPHRDVMSRDLVELSRQAPGRGRIGRVANRLTGAF